MKISIGVGPLWGANAGLDVTVEDAAAHVAAAQHLGVDTAWMPQVSLDALTVLALAGSLTPGIRLATGVVPIQPRHPTMLAAQARTVADLTQGRLTLGIGLSHKIAVEGMWGLSYDKPALRMREYLTVLLALLRGESVAFAGETVAVHMPAAGSAPAHAVPVVVAALGTQMLRVAGELADGTVTWMTSPKVLADHVVPIISDAASGAGRSAPRIIAPVPLCVTSDAQRARQDAEQRYGMYGGLPSYRSMLDKNAPGSAPVDVSIIGTEDQVLAQIAEYEDAGATEFVGVVFGTDDECSRTTELLAGLVRR